MKNDSLFLPPTEEELNDPLFAAPTEEELKSSEDPKKMSGPEIFLKGAEQGVTFGGAPMIAGGIQKAMDRLAQLGIPGLLPEGVTQTPDQMTQQLKSQGFSGDLPTTYESARDDQRQVYKDAQAQSNGEYLAGNIAGGALTMLTPGGVGKLITNPFGKAAEGAGKAKQYLMAAKNAAPAGLVTGFNVSEAKDAAGIAQDTVTGGLFAAGAGAAVPMVADGAGAVKNAVGDLIESKLPSVARAYEKGKQGIKTYSKEFALGVDKKYKEFREPVLDFFKEKKLEIQQRTESLKEINEKLINSVSNQIDNTSDQLKQYMQIGLDKKTKQLNRGQVVLQNSEKIQKNILKSKNNVRQSFDAVENQIDDANISFNINDEISQFEEQLQINGLLPEQAAALRTKFLPFFEKTDLTVQELKQAKLIADKMADSANPSIGRAARGLYSGIRKKQIDTIRGSGEEFNIVADQLENINKKWLQVNDLEDNFIGSLQKDKALNTVTTNKEMISSLENSIRQDAKNLNETQIFRQKLNQFDPDSVKLFDDASRQISKIDRSLEALKNQDPAKNSAELRRLKDLLENLKKGIDNSKASLEVKTQVDELLNQSEKQIKDYLGFNLKNVLSPLKESNPARENIENLLETVAKAKDKPNMLNDANELMKDAELVKDASEEFRGMLSPRSIGAIQSAGQYPANMAGRAVGAVSRVSDKINKNTSTMKNIFTDDVTNIISNLKKFNTPEAELYASQLQSVAQDKTNTVKKSAIINSMLQQPTFRKLLNITEDEQK